MVLSEHGAVPLMRHTFLLVHPIPILCLSALDLPILDLSISDLFSTLDLRLSERSPSLSSVFSTNTTMSMMSNMTEAPEKGMTKGFFYGVTLPQVQARPTKPSLKPAKPALEPAFESIEEHVAKLAVAILLWLQVDECVIVRVKEITHGGAFAELLDYGGAEGIIVANEYSRRRMNDASQHFKIGNKEAVSSCVALSCFTQTVSNALI